LVEVEVINYELPEVAVSNSVNFYISGFSRHMLVFHKLHDYRHGFARRVDLYSRRFKRARAGISGAYCDDVAIGGWCSRTINQTKGEMPC